ncbi:MAG: peptide chain release factor 2, partial [Bacilli bacterium]|nr:peptide chain release factor 2 [Bacilli bacterium]
ILESITSNLEILELLKVDEDIDLLENSKIELNNIEKRVKEYEVKSLLDGEFDASNCFLEIHPGAGGTESCDWANMLLRMYTMFCDKFGFKYQIVDKQNGDEAGIKSVMLYITGNYCYGYLKSEIGVHRLVRISPFNAAGKRQTSFAAVNVTPEFASVGDIEIKDEDVRIDVYRSSGCGGQGVNTTDSAVRITHIPSGIVVTVQNERSQLKNKEIAFNILKSKLYNIEVEKRNSEINALKGNANINFGSQIRNYVLEPYSLVKDVRTEHESNIPSKVLDGEIYPFIEAYLRMKR